MSQINYLIKQDVEKVSRKKRYEAIEGDWYVKPAMDGDYTPVTLVRHSECTIIENPVLTKLRKKFKQAKVRIRERAFHMHGVPYVQIMAA